MPIPTGTAAISFSQLRTEMHTGLGNPAAYSSFPLNDGTFRSRLTDTAVNGALSLSALRGNAYLRFTIAANTTNYNIRTAFLGGYAAWPGATKASADVVVNSGVVVGTASTGAYAMDTGGPWPAPSTIVVYNSGTVVGMGGAGGNGSPAGSPGSTTPGSAGGPALIAQRGMTLVNSGTVAGGGGGGGGGRGNVFSTPLGTPINAGGGGGGGGRTSNTPSAGGTGGSAGGANPFPGNPGFAGTFAAAGAGRGSGGPAPGGGVGGTGGNWGTAGAASAGPAPTLPARAGGAAGISVQGWSVVTAPTGTTGISGPTAG